MAAILNLNQIRSRQFAYKMLKAENKMKCTDTDTLSPIICKKGNMFLVPQHVFYHTMVFVAGFNSD